MTPPFIVSPQVRNDLDAIGEAHRLSLAECDRLARIVAGAIPGNRDLPLHGLADSIRLFLETDANTKLGLFDLLALAAERRPPKTVSRLSFALLDFLATMDNYRYFNEVELVVTTLSAGGDEQGLAKARSVFAACLHRYRMDYLPFENRRQAFGTIRGFFSASKLGRERPEDGDAIEFWAQVATSDGWTKYETTLQALADFTEASEMRVSSSMVSLDALAEKGFEASAGVTSNLGDGESVLQDALTFLTSTELKVFKGPALEELARLAKVLPALRRWRRSGLAALCFGPVQNVLVQLKRQGAPPGHFPEVAACSDVSGYSDKLAELAEIHQMCEDIFVLYRGVRQMSDRNGPRSSTDDPEYQKRVGRLMRRKSLAGLEARALQEKTEYVIPSIVTVQALVGKVVAQIGAWPAASRDAAFKADRDRFADTFRRLYCGVEN